MNTVPFNYDLIEKGYKVVTRGGREVSEVYKFKTTVSERPILAAVNGQLIQYGNDGVYYHETDLSLVMIPPVVEKWINVYPTGPNDCRSHRECYEYKSLEKATEAKSGSGRVPEAFTIKATYQNDEIISVELVK